MPTKSEKIHLKPDVLRILRENSGYSIGELAKKLGVSQEKIKRVEGGNDDFTIKQIKKLAAIYKVPLAAFFSDSISHIPSLPDYRINRTKKIPSTVYLAIRRAKYLSDIIHKLSGRRTTLPAIPKDLSPKDLASNFRDFLKPSPPRGASPSKILDYYKMLVEEKLNVLIIEYPLKADDVRAFTIRGNLSVIVLNESDEAQVKLFSLFHEIGHLFREESGICSIFLEVENQEIERYCNRFAAEFLVPEEEFREDIRVLGDSFSSLKRLQRKYGVSIQVFMIRLLNLGLTSREKYLRFQEEFKKQEKKKGGGRNWETVYKNRAGRLSIEEVRKAYKQGKITLHESMEILGMKLKYAEKLIE